MTPVGLLVTSVGSLVGQNILDMLEPRRHQVRLIGTTDATENPRLYRCDIVHLVPPTQEQAAFETRILEIIEEEQPDLVIAARDPDVLLQARWRESRPELTPLLTAGPLEVAQAMQDKLLSSRFAAEHGLPFAETATCGPDGHLGPVYALAETCGYPLLAKPRSGYG